MGLGAGQIALDTDFAAVEAASSEKPVVQIYLAAPQSIPDNTLTALSFGAENLDSHGFHSTTVNPTRVTPTIAGIYRVYASLFLAGRTDYATVKLVTRKNGAELAPCASWGNLDNAVTHGFSYTGLVVMNGTTDYVEICVQQDNTANVAVNAEATNPRITLMEMEFVRAPI